MSVRRRRLFAGVGLTTCVTFSALLPALFGGCGSQQPEHVRIIAHDSRPEMLESRGLGLHFLCKHYPSEIK